MQGAEQEKVVLEQEKEVETEVVKCESCGSNMVFDPQTQKLKCLHCDSEISFDSSNSNEIDLKLGLENDREWTADEAVVFRCENCGAKVVLSYNATAKTCPFCGTAHVQKIEELIGIKPNAVIPFAFDDNKALEYSKAWAKKRFFAPRKFKKNLRADNVKGVYAPTFTFDSSTVSYYQGRIGKTHTRVVGSGKNRRTQTYVVWRNISGVYNSNFDDVLITAGKKFTQEQVDKISPFDTNASKTYDENYLLGFMAYHYDNELADCWKSAKDKMDGYIRQGILSNYSYDKVSYLNVSTTHSNVTYKYVMLPVYVGSYKYKKKLYNFFVNGNTGKTTGRTPISAFKIILTVLLGLALIAGIYFLASS